MTEKDLFIEWFRFGTWWGRPLTRLSIPNKAWIESALNHLSTTPEKYWYVPDNNKIRIKLSDGY